MMPISLCILSWKSPLVLEKSLKTYKKNGLLDITDDKTILFQNFSNTDYDVASRYNLNIIGVNENIGIGNGFKKLAQNSKYENVLLLEHDFNLVETEEILRNTLKSGIEFLDSGIDVIRLRHRKKFGEPLFSKEYMGKELSEFDKMANERGTHLLESLYWCDPSIKFPEQIKKINDWFLTTSRWANFTNNPCMYKKSFYLNSINGYEGNGIELENNISHWWCKQNFKIIQGNGLFKHNDFVKYGMLKKQNELI